MHWVQSKCQASYSCWVPDGWSLTAAISMTSPGKVPSGEWGRPVSIPDRAKTEYPLFQASGIIQRKNECKKGSCTSLQPLNHVNKKGKWWKGELKDKDREKRGWNSVASFKLRKITCKYYEFLQSLLSENTDREHWRTKNTHYTERKALSKELENNTKWSKKWD